MNMVSKNPKGGWFFGYSAAHTTSEPQITCFAHYSTVLILNSSNTSYTGEINIHDVIHFSCLLYSRSTCKLLKLKSILTLQKTTTFLYLKHVTNIYTFHMAPLQNKK